MTTQKTDETKTEQTSGSGQAGQPDPSPNGKVDWESDANPYKPFKNRYDGLRKAAAKGGETAELLRGLTKRLDNLEEQNADLLDRLESAPRSRPAPEDGDEDGAEDRPRPAQPTSAARERLKQARTTDFVEQARQAAARMQTAWQPGMSLEEPRLARANKLFKKAQASQDSELLAEAEAIFGEVAAEFASRADLSVRKKGKKGEPADNDKGPAAGADEGADDDAEDDEAPPEKPSRRAELKKRGAGDAQSGDGSATPSDDSTKSPIQLFREAHEEARNRGG